jgi:Asp-tRNA(Asn)/Glu-tRNA(Gln) amidotransferase A subunit family amidase
MNPLSLSTDQLASALARGEVTASDLAASALLQQKHTQESLNAFTHVFASTAEEQARASDARRRAGNTLGALDGIPVSIKGNLAVRGAPHHGGLSFRRDLAANDDAKVVERLTSAGAVLLGLTNLDEGALGASGQNTWFGDVSHPRDANRLPGGSTAGGAVAVAANICPLSIGSDTVGSVRIPAAFCGVSALKPTYGAVSMRGLLATHPRFDHVGLLARHAGDLAIGLQCVAGWDRESPTSFPVDLRAAARQIAPLRIGFVVGLDQAPLSQLVLEGFNSAIAALRRLGHAVTHIDITNWDLRRSYRAVFALCEVAMARTHAERMDKAPQTFSPQLLGLLRFGAAQRTEDLDRYEKRIAALTHAVNSAFEQVDVLLTPTVPTIDVRVDDAGIAESALYTAIASATGRPALALPVRAGTASDSPASIQLIGNSGSDYELIKLAQSLEAAIS